MRKLWLVIKREYIVRVRSKAFIWSTIALPLFTLGIFALTAFLATRPADHTLKIAILDEAGGLAPAVRQGLTEKLRNGQPAFEVVETQAQPDARQALRAQVQSGELDAYLLLPKDAVEGKSAVEAHTRNPGDMTLAGSLERAVSDAVIARRLKDRGIDLGDVGQVIRGVEVKLIKVTQQGEREEKGQTFLAAMIVALLLYTTLVIYGVTTMRAVMEEKSTRMIEILVASVRPFHLLSGKILGVAAVAVTQYLIWGATAEAFAAYGTAMASAFRPGASLPSFHLPLSWLVYLLIFFLAGYLLYASLYAAVGAMVSNEQEAQQVQAPLSLLIVISLLLFNVILRNPNSRLSVVLSVLPFLSPILMMLRIAIQTPPAWQIALALVLSAVTTVAVVQFSARIYRVGVLMYGKRPSLAELARWLRYS